MADNNKMPTVQRTDAIEVDPEIGEGSSDYESAMETDSTTTSLTSTVNQYLEENGRRYHAYYGTDKNMMPADETEQDRLDLHHELLLQIFEGRLTLAPVDNINLQRVLDIGTGTGIWAIDFADTYPSAEVIGTDLSPIQPKWVPTNCRFEVDDAELDFTYKPDHFDFVHMRNIGQGISDWPRLISQVFKVTKPGGYIELSELGLIPRSDDNTLLEDNPILISCTQTARAMKILGRPEATLETVTKPVQDAGFVDIVAQELRQPLGPWPKKKNLKMAGNLALLVAETGFEAYGMAAFTRILKMSHEEASKLCQAAVAASKSRKTHCYHPYYVVYGRKPE